MLSHLNMHSIWKNRTNSQRVILSPVSQVEVLIRVTERY